MTENKFLNLVTNPLVTLDHTYRYSGTKLVEAESLAQHVVDTIMIGILMIDYINTLESKEVFSIPWYVMKATYHDLEEIITGDVPRPLKYYNEDTRKSLKKVAELIARDTFVENTQNPSYHYTVWYNAKEGDEGFILRIVDMLTVAYKCVKEISLLNNYYMLKVAHEVSTYIGEILYTIDSDDVFTRLSQGSRSYIRQVLSDAIKAMREIINTHAPELQDLNIISQSLIKQE